MKTAKKVICIVLVVCLLVGMFMIPVRAAGNPYWALLEGLLVFVDITYNVVTGIKESYRDEDGSTYPALYFSEPKKPQNHLSFEGLNNIASELASYGLDVSVEVFRYVENLRDIKTAYGIRVYPRDGEFVDSLLGGYFFCSASDRIYYADVDDPAAVTTPRDHYTEVTNDNRQYNDYEFTHNETYNTTDESTTIYDHSDNSTTIEDLFVNLDERTFYDQHTETNYDIERFLYNPEDYTYHLRVSDSNNYYDYRVTYNVAYTSVTYIGSSEEFNETYIYYFELPDGRSSADLTAEDLEQLSLSFDVVNYGVSCDDGSLRSLYHFDGDVEDTSYWTNYTSFEWLENASITYLESNAFNGCLYLDELAHSFKISLPNNLAAGDFSILFRYYQSQYGTEGTDMTIDCGDVNLLSYAGTDLPVGTWVEIALIRDSGTLYVYENGLCVSSGAMASVLDRELTFAWVEGTQNYHWLDELRVYNFAYYEDGAPYTPTAVPVDTNAVLVLPDEAVPIPDAYWSFDDEGNMLPTYDLTTGTEDLLGRSRLGYHSTNGLYSYFAYNNDFKYAIYRPAEGSSKTSYTNFGRIYSESVTLEPLSSYSTAAYPVYYSSAEAYIWYLSRGYMVPFRFYDTNPSTDIDYDLGVEAGKTYTFSLLLSDGSVSSVTFTAAALSTTVAYTSAEFDWGKIIYSEKKTTGNGTLNWRGVFIQPTQPIDVVYMELVEGEANDGHKHVTELYSSLDLTGPTIAVRSQIDVRTYRIGGVRPTLAYRGDVWCLVENNRIASCQIYNGFAWTEVDCRIWTGVRWVPPSYYDVVTLQDLFDVEGTTDNEYIQTETGYYKWLQTQFKELLEILNTISDKIEDIGGGSSISMDFDIDGVLVNFSDLSDGSTFRLLEVFIFFDEVLFDGLLHDETFSFDDYKDVFMGDTVTDGEETGFSVFSIFNYTGDDIWE